MTWNDVLNFLQQYYVVIIDVIGFIVVLIIQLCKKNKIVVGSDPWIELLGNLPGLINEAEAQGLKGDGKLQYVVAKALDSLCSTYGESVYKDRQLVKNIIAAIESILSTPQKK